MDEKQNNNKKMYVGVIGGIIIIAILFLVLNFFNSRFTDNTSNSATTTGDVNSANMVKAMFLCEDGSSIKAVFTDKDVSLTLSDNRNIKLPQIDAEFGAMFQSPDGITTFSVLGPLASLEENGAVTHSECIESKG